MNKLISNTILFLLLYSTLIHARAPKDTGKYAFSLQQAVDYALKNQPQILNAVLDERIAKHKVKETTGIGLPQINGNVSAQDFIEIPTTVIPAKAFNPFAPDDAYMAVQFGIQYNASAGIEVSQLVFSSDYLVGLQASKTYLDLSRKATQRTKIDITIAVTKAYYTALLNDERMKLVNVNLSRVKKLMDDTKALHENGFIEKIDLDRITVAYNNLLAEKEKIQRMTEIGIALLKFQMGMNIASTLSLTDTLSDIKFTPDISAEKFDYGKRIEYSLLMTQKNVSQLQLKRYRMHRLPTAVLFGSASANAYRDKFNFLDTKQPWYPTVIVGGKVSVGIFDGRQTHHRIQQAKLELEKSENNLKLIEQSIDLEILSAKAGMQNAVVLLEIQKKNMELAESVFKTAKKKYEQGVGSNLEVMNAETALKEAQTNYFSALHDALISKAEYDKATGNIK